MPQLANLADHNGSDVCAAIVRIVALGLIQEKKSSNN
jgi:hypothetical protein